MIGDFGVHLLLERKKKGKEREEEGKLGRDEGRGRNKEGKEVRRHHSKHCSVKEIIRFSSLSCNKRRLYEIKAP